VPEFKGQDTNHEQSLMATKPETTHVYSGYSYYTTLRWVRVISSSILLD